MLGLYMCLHPFFDTLDTCLATPLIIIITGFIERQIAKGYKALLHYYPWSLGQYQSLNFLSSLGSIQPQATVAHRKLFPTTISTSTLTGTHSYSWVKRSTVQGHKYRGRGQESNPHATNLEVCCAFYNRAYS